MSIAWWHSFGTHRPSSFAGRLIEEVTAANPKAFFYLYWMVRTSKALSQPLVSSAGLGRAS
jgi:hypothetical protein